MGHRVDPFEVESALKEHPAVASLDETRGEIIKIFVILAPGYTASHELASELQKHVKRLIERHNFL